MNSHGEYISILAVIMIVITIWKVWKIFREKQADYKLLDLVLMAGSLAAAVGIFSQIVGIVQALEAIRAAADISPQIVLLHQKENRSKRFGFGYGGGVGSRS